MHRDRISASEINNFENCQMQWFLQYPIGIRTPSGKAAVIGSAAHYVLEAVANCVLLQQNNGKLHEDKIVGDISQDLEIDKWVEKSWEYHKSREKTLDFKRADFLKYKRTVDKALAHKELSPLNVHEVIAPEMAFQIPINRDWAKFDDQVLCFKGFVDLVFRREDGTFAYTDYKSGSNKCWVTGKEKDYQAHMSDTQMCAYYWAMRMLHPYEDHIEGNIYYINLDTHYTLCIDDNDVDSVLDRIGERVQRMRSLDQPSVLYERKPEQKWKCKWCYFSQNRFEGEQEWLNINYNPFAHQFSPIDGSACICDAVKTMCRHRPLELVLENVKK